MRYGLGITLLALALVGTPVLAEERIEINVGASRLLTLGEMTRLALGDPRLAEVRTVGANQVEVTGKAPGTTKLLVWVRSGERREYTLEVKGDAARGAPAKTAGAAAAPSQTVTLKRGDTHEVRVKGVSRVALGDPQVADVSVSESDVLRIEARKAGETTLLIWTGPDVRREYRIVVRD